MSISKKNSEDKGVDREHPHLNHKDNLVWLDMEMSGLDPNTCRILEIAIIVTDRDLNPLHEGIEFVLKQSDYFLNKMGAFFCKQRQSFRYVAGRQKS